MSRTWRIVAVWLGVAFVSAGCDKSGSSSASKPGDETYGKKVVGVWEGALEDAPKPIPITVEFKADNGLKFTMGSGKDGLESTGTWKVVKEEGKTVTAETEMSSPFEDPKGPKKTQKKTMSIVFEDANTIVMSEVGDKPNPLKLKRKS